MTAVKNAKALKNYLVNLIKFSVAAGLIYWLVSSGNLDFGLLFSLLSPTFLLGVFGITLLNLSMNNLRWLLLLRSQGLGATYWNTFKLSLIGLFFNFAMPGGVGGDIVKGYYVVQGYPEKKMASAVSIFVDRLVGLFSMVLISLIALALNYHLMDGRPDLQSLAEGAMILFGGFLLAVALALSNRSKGFFYKIFEILPGGTFLQKLHESFYAYRSSPLSLFYALMLSLVSQTFAVIFFILVGEAMAVNIPWQAYFFVVPVGLIAMSAPIAPAGIGIGQAAFLALFTMYLGYQSPVGPTAVTLNQLVLLCWGLVGAVFYFSRKHPSLETLQS